MNKPELLCPAGTLDKLKIAFEYGADAVYAGVPDFSLRARINDFNYAKIKQGVEYAHKWGKKVYATLNIYPRNSYLKKIETALKTYAESGVDAVIVSDPGILTLVKKVATKMEIHLSTQANCTNYEAAKFWYEQGVSRIVLARETTLREIQQIHKKLPKLELEYFVHGAMCMAYSGRCILSKWLSGRSANLGECSQPCRWEYDFPSFNSVILSDEGAKDPAACSKDFIPASHLGILRPPGARTQNDASNTGKELIIEQDKNGTYILNSKDLCLIEYLDKLWKAGITSFKIEGRTKSAYYVGATAKLYREGIDRIKKGGVKYVPPKGWEKELEKITNRGYTTGFLFGEEKCEHNFKESHCECAWQFVGEVADFKTPQPPFEKGGREEDFEKGGREEDFEKGGIKEDFEKGGIKEVFIKVHNVLRSGDEVEFVVPRGENIKVKVEKMYDAESNKEIKEAHGGQEKIIFLQTSETIPVRSMVRRKI